MSPASKSNEKTKEAPKGSSGAPRSHREPVQGGQLAAILLRGLINTNHDIRAALVNLRLRKKHVCVILPDNAANRGMLEHCKDYITWGEVDEVAIKELDSKRANKTRTLTAEDKLHHLHQGKLAHYHLNSPRGGFERNGIKKTYEEGGALGYRADKISALIKKMI